MECNHILNQELLARETKEKPNGDLYTLESYACGECGEEYNEMRDM
jgi:hypothetical protein